jgi:hypothetical protein
LPPFVTEASLEAVPPLPPVIPDPAEPALAVSMATALYVTVATPPEIEIETVCPAVTAMSP